MRRGTFVSWCLCALLGAVVALTVGSALAAPKPCEPGTPGCKTEVTQEQTKETGAAPGFNTQTQETQRGNVDAKGTESTETSTTTCTGPSGKTLDPSHPQC